MRENNYPTKGDIVYIDKDLYLNRHHNKNYDGLMFGEDIYYYYLDHYWEGTSICYLLYDIKYGNIKKISCELLAADFIIKKESDKDLLFIIKYAEYIKYINDKKYINYGIFLFILYIVVIIICIVK